MVRRTEFLWNKKKQINNWTQLLSVSTTFAVENLVKTFDYTHNYW